MCGLVWCVVAVFCVAPPADTRSIVEYVRALGADDFKAREEATRALMRRQDAAAALLAALDSPDLEVRSRAGKVLAALRAGRAGEVGRLAGRLLRAGRIDLAVELLVENGGFDRRSERWPDLESGLAGLHQPEFVKGSRPSILQKGARWFANLAPDRDASRHSSRGLSFRNFEFGVAICRGFEAERVFISVVLATHDVRVNFDCIRSLVLTTARSVRIKEAITSVVVCAGDVTFLNNPSDCVIIARGAVHFSGSPTGCIILSNGAVTYGRGRPAEGLGHPAGCLVREHQRGPLAGIRFFEMDEFGLVMARGTDVARAVLPGVFGDAGLYPGDSIVSVGGEKAAHAEQIRTLFVRHFLRPGPVFLEVLRGGETRTLYVNTPEVLKAPPK